MSGSGGGGSSAPSTSNVEVDGTLKVDTSNRKISVLKGGQEVIISEYNESITSEQINTLFQ
jgi:hypothetical protein